MFRQGGKTTAITSGARPGRSKYGSALPAPARSPSGPVSHPLPNIGDERIRNPWTIPPCPPIRPPARVPFRDPELSARPPRAPPSGQPPSLPPPAAGRKKLHTTWEDGTELIEEYDVNTEELVLRRRRKKTPLGKATEWEYLYGDPPSAFNSAAGLLQESSRNPTFTRMDTRELFQFRIRNLPYPSDVFEVSVDAAQRQVVIRTTIKKYFKRFGIPELDVLDLGYDGQRLQWHHANNTLVVSYAKPPEVLTIEEEERVARRAMKSQQDGDVDCKTQ